MKFKEKLTEIFVFPIFTFFCGLSEKSQIQGIITSSALWVRRYYSWNDEILSKTKTVRFLDRIIRGSKWTSGNYRFFQKLYFEIGKSIPAKITTWGGGGRMDGRGTGGGTNFPFSKIAFPRFLEINITKMVSVVEENDEGWKYYNNWKALSRNEARVHLWKRRNFFFKDNERETMPLTSLHVRLFGDVSFKIMSSKNKEKQKKKMAKLRHLPVFLF